MARILLALAGVAALAVGCGDDSPGSATAPSPTTSAVTVTLNSPLRVGQTTQATGTATLSSGQTQAVTSGWQSDVPSVATVTDAGLVTGVANGRANVYVVSGGQQGLAQVRVVPDFQGRWNGRLVVTSCTHTGLWATAGNFCGEFPAGFSSSFGLSVTQSGELLSAVANYGSAVFPSTSSSIQPDGSSSFTVTLLVPETPIAVETHWVISAPRAGELTGTVTEVWRAPGIAGEGRLVQDVTSVIRTSATPMSAASDEPASAKWLTLMRLPWKR
jgi:hypothetical protein